LDQIGMEPLSDKLVPCAPTSPGAWPARYGMLDAWRGVAALGVVLHHVADVDMGIRAGRVVVFFVISGYCIAASAESCLRKGEGAWVFMRRRLVRIYPAYLLCLAYWGVLMTARLIPRAPGTLHRSAGFWFKNLTLTQWTTLLADPRSVPWRNRSLAIVMHWSLGYEVQFYAAVGVMLLAAAFLRRGLGPLFALTLAAGLAWNLAYPTTCFGALGDYWVHFGLGAVAFYRLTRTPGATARRLIDCGLLAFFAACVYVRWFSGIHWTGEFPGRVRVTYGELAVASAAALLMIGLRTFDARWNATVLTRPFAWLGRISYSLFLVHPLNGEIVGRWTDGLVPTDMPGWVSVVVQMILHVALAAAFWAVCERWFLSRADRGAARRARNPASTEVASSSPGLPRPQLG